MPWLLWLGLVYIHSAFAQLPNFKPDHYDLNLNLVNAPHFTGTVKIFGQMIGQDIIRNISLHEGNLNIVADDIKVECPEGKKTVNNVIKDKENEILTINFDTYLYANMKCTIQLKFSGKFNNKNRQGIFSSSNIIATNFFPNHARSVFPCFDQPNMMATFALGVTHRSDWKAYSYSAASTRLTKQTTSITNFEKSPLMSPHNLGFFLTEGYTELTPKGSGLSFIVKNQNDFKLNTVLNIYANVTKFHEFFHPKSSFNLYIVDVPNLPVEVATSYNIISMKSGLVNFDQEMTTKNRLDFCLLILNALAKQYYGVRVSPRRWNDVLLYESIPVYLQMYAFRQTDSLIFDKNIAQDLEIELFEKGFEDCPVYPEAKSEQLVQATNSTNIVVSPQKYKGAAILSMLDEFLKENGKVRIANLIFEFFSDMENLGAPVDTEMFLKYVENKTESFLRVDTMMAWLRNPGYPILQVSLVEGNITITLKNLFQNVCSTNFTMEAWKIPVIYQIQSSNESSYFFDGNFETPITLENEIVDEWVVINNRGSGLYRVFYDEILWSRLALKFLNQDVGTVAQRSRIISDSFAAPKFNLSDPFISMNVTNYLKYEKEYMPWKVAIEGFNDLRNIYFGDEKLLESLELKYRVLLEYVYNEIGDTEQNLLETNRNMNRYNILSSYCKFGNKDCQKLLLNDWKKLNNSELSPNLYGYDAYQAISCIGIAHDTHQSQCTTFHNYISSYNVYDSSYRKERIFELLSCTSCENRYLEHIIKMPGEDALQSFKIFNSHPEKLDHAIAFFLNKFSKYKNTFSHEVIVQMVKDIATKLSTDKQLSQFKKLNDFIDEKKDKELKEALLDGEITINSTRNFKTTNRGNISEWSQIIPVTTSTSSFTTTSLTSTTSSSTIPNSTSNTSTIAPTSVLTTTPPGTTTTPKGSSTTKSSTMIVVLPYKFWYILSTISILLLSNVLV